MHRKATLLGHLYPFTLYTSLLATSMVSVPIPLVFQSIAHVLSITFPDSGINISCMCPLYAHTQLNPMPSPIFWVPVIPLQACASFSHIHCVIIFILTSKLGHMRNIETRSCPKMFCWCLPHSLCFNADCIASISYSPYHTQQWKLLYCIVYNSKCSQLWSKKITCQVYYIQIRRR